MAVIVTQGSEILYNRWVNHIDMSLLNVKNLFDPELGDKVLNMYTCGLAEDIPQEYLDEIVDFATEHDLW